MPTRTPTRNATMAPPIATEPERRLEDSEESGGDVVLDQERLHKHDRAEGARQEHGADQEGVAHFRVLPGERHPILQVRNVR